MGSQAEQDFGELETVPVVVSLHVGGGSHTKSNV